MDPLLRKITHQLDIRMRLDGIKNATVMITELADQPPQE